MNENTLASFPIFLSVTLFLPVTENCGVLHCPFSKMKSSIPRDEPCGSLRDNRLALRKSNEFSSRLEDMHRKKKMDQHSQLLLQLTVNTTA